ncbi:glycosyltransferase family 4 protein [Bacillus thuringiensis]|uniref:glycosyltransferase family 4 protein n=1 Tax=Bacillus thuringiensis TaxID=1428 RepID=UPI003337D9B0
MKICILTGAYHPKVGGAETYARTIAEGIKKIGHEVIVLTDGVGINEPMCEEIGGVKVVRAFKYADYLEDPTKVRWEQMYFGLLHELYNYIKNENIDVIHANSLDTAILGSMISSSLHIPLVCTIHEQEPEKERFGTGKCDVVFSKIGVEKFITGSEFYFNKVLEFCKDITRVERIYHGIDLEKFSPVDNKKYREEMWIEEDEFLIVCVARLKERKGLMELIRSIRPVKDKISNIKVIIAGSCNSASREYADSLYKEIEKLDLGDTIRIDETLTYSDMPRIYAAADLVVQPSYAEGLGLSVLEGLASGKAVVATNVTGIKEIISHYEDGILVPSKQVEPLSESILEVIKDASLRKRLGENGRLLVETKFNYDRMIKETEKVYLDLLNSNKR